MKKYLKLTIIILLLLIITPQNIYAASTGYRSISGNVSTVEDNKVIFTGLKYADLSDSIYPSIGVSGLVTNNNNYQIFYTTTTTFYDAKLNVLGTINRTGSVPATTSYSFSNQTDLQTLNLDPSSVLFYKFDFTTQKMETDTTDSLTPSTNSLYKSYEYVIDKYNVDITVNENNTFDITENITAYFNTPKHGIIRSIPLKNIIIRLDGTMSTNHPRITNLSVDNSYATSRSVGYYKIQIGSASKTITGTKSYTIKYNYNLGKDPLKDKDELYFNIIGTEWDTVIGNLTFKITMPKDFDKSKLGFSSGLFGSTSSNNVEYEVKDNVITGKYTKILNKNEGLTIRCELPEGYFVNAGFPLPNHFLLMFLIPLVCLIVAIYLWYKYGKDEKAIETVEFYPPEGFNSLEVGFVYKGIAVNKDVTSLLIYLANQGYLKITEFEEKSLFAKAKSFKIIKLKEYVGNNINERLFMEGLFKTGNEVTESELDDHFYVTTSNILSNINNKENKREIFEKLTSFKIFTLICLLLITILTIVLIPSIEYTGPISALGTVMLFIFYTPFFAVGLFAAIPLLIRIFVLVFVSVHCAVFLSQSSLGEAIMSEPIYLLGVIFGFICLIGIGICIKYMPKRTKKGNELLGKVKGFKNFLETAEKERLEAMVMNNPTYFYDILPFTYVLDVSDKWIKKFESINIEPPTWYDSPSAFDYLAFSSFMNSTMTSANHVMSSSPSSSSGGGGSSSGGGSSGGGSGGGGGSSW